MDDASNGNTVEDVEHIDLSKVSNTGKDDGADIEEEVVSDDTSDDKEGDENDTESPDGKKESLVHRQSNQIANDDDSKSLSEDELKKLPNETPRERALRLEVTRTKRLLRAERSEEIIEANATVQKKELSEGQKATLGKYNQEELASLREVLPILADEMGYVRSDALQAGTYAEKATAELDAFLSEHQQYLPENDHDNVLWDRFKTEFGLYKQPSNPKDYRKIFNRIHTEIFGIQTNTGDKKGEIDAQRHKVSVGSQNGTSGSVSASRKETHKPSASGLRLDMLKGFDADELEELERDAG